MNDLGDFYLVAVAVVYGKHELVEKGSYVERRQALGVAFELRQQGFLDVLKDKVDPLVFLKHLEQTDHVRVPKTPQHADFSMRRFPHVFVLVRFFELLDSHESVGTFVSGLVHSAVGATCNSPFSNSFKDFVFFHYS